MVDVVNDVLALTQFITNSRSEEQSIAFLLAIETLSIDNWRTAKKDLGITDVTNHRTKEAFIKEVVSAVKSDTCYYTYLFIMLGSAIMLYKHITLVNRLIIYII